MNISVVIPLLNEQDSLTELHDWIAKVMQSNRFSYEIIFIDDGSTDDSWSTIMSLSLSTIPSVTIILLSISVTINVIIQ